MREGSMNSERQMLVDDGDCGVWWRRVRGRGKSPGGFTSRDQSGQSPLVPIIDHLWRSAFGVPEFSDRRASWFGHMLTVAATIDFGFSFSTAADTEVTGPKNNISDEQRPETHLYLYGAPKPGLSNSLAS
jgi:hypothetical protein